MVGCKGFILKPEHTWLVMLYITRKRILQTAGQTEDYTALISYTKAKV